MKNIEKYKDELLNNRCSDLTCCVIDLFNNGVCIPATCNDCKAKVMNWLLSEYKEPVLDEVEKEYLKAVIKPFRNKVKYITKFKCQYSENKRYINILFSDEGYLSFPYFKADSMYKGMELNKYYTLEELGL
jgi:hypothetical protein